jgi:hypothetical protein
MSRAVIVGTEDWEASDATREKLEGLVAAGLLLRVTDVANPEWMVPPLGHRIPNPPEGYIVSFMAFHERGFGMPASRFLCALLHHYEIELQNLAPNSITQAAVFVALCEGFLGIEVHWDLWIHFFEAVLFTKAAPSRKEGERLVARTGGCTFQLRAERRSSYIPAGLASSNRGWHAGWFYLRNDRSRLPAFTGKVLGMAPSRWREDLPAGREASLRKAIKALSRLTKMGLTAAVVVANFHRRRVLPLMARRICLYGMKEEASWEETRMAPDDLEHEEVAKRVKKAVAIKDPDLPMIWKVPMRPDQGHPRLVSRRTPEMVFVFAALVHYPLFLRRV